MFIRNLLDPPSLALPPSFSEWTYFPFSGVKCSHVSWSVDEASEEKMTFPRNCPQDLYLQRGVYLSGFANCSRTFVASECGEGLLKHRF